MNLSIKDIRLVRIANGIMQKEFAELIGIPIGTWSNVERGFAKLHAEVGAKAVSALKELGCDFSVLDGDNPLFRERAYCKKPRNKEQTEEVIDVKEESVQLVDMVNHPSHYADRKFEVIDVMEDTMNEEQYIGYLFGCTFKYLTRWDKKGTPEQDLKKAHWYLNKLITAVERKNIEQQEGA